MLMNALFILSETNSKCISMNGSDVYVYKIT